MLVWTTVISRSQRTFWRRNNQQVEKWFKKFKSSDTNLADEEGRGRPLNFDDQALLAALEEDESMTTRMLAEEFNVDHCLSSQKAQKSMKIGWMGPPRTLRQHQSRRCPNFPQFAVVKRTNSVPEESRRWG